MRAMDRKLVDKLLPVLAGLRIYHRHSVMGLEAIPPSGKVLVVCNHSLATYDIALLMHAIHQSTGRIPRPLMDRLFYKIPYLGDFVSATGGMEGSRSSALALLERDEIVVVAPGGMQEALRPSSERYQIRWDQRRGFVQLAIESGTPIVLAVCPKADDMYDVYPNRVTSWAYKTFKIPLFVARGIGYTPFPKPIQLTHFLSDPIIPPKPAATPEGRRRQILRFHRKLVATAEKLIDDAVEFRPGYLPPARSVAKTRSKRTRG